MLFAQVPLARCADDTLLLVAPSHGIRGFGAAQAFVVAAIVGPVSAVFLRRVGVRMRDTLRA